ncbi:MAG: phenylalanine--tRNA ligase subunit beta [Streptococcaceae bacterium]|jgi:phenylalanyl-tRNA synthetase beta chain|nr:phenylalanine--tRNA ligase subunit beta [Streptococcaceae bacterium]
MNVSEKWIKSLVPIQASAQEIADKMSTTGIEVEGVIRLQDGLKKLVVGYVETCIPHPDSDHLSVCMVDVGEDAPIQIVCGAPNIKADKKVIVALVGARIAGNYKIKKGKIRGAESFGMICSLQEIGFDESVVPKEVAEGIYFMPEEAVVGDEVYPYLDMDDSILELSITPNRADALSMLGVAYELAAIYDQPFTPEKVRVDEEDSESVQDYVNVTVVDANDCPTYKMRVIKNVTIQESPLWLQKRLMSAGMRPINNVVDVTNYVLMLYGQPLHAFDYGKLASKEILVRRAHENETMTTLDGQERILSSENIVITNGEKPVALAGVMGGQNTEVDAETTTVALEAALFDPTLTRLTSKKFHLRSESSMRFEKGINVATVGEAGDFAASLIAELSGGVVVSQTAIGSEQVARNVEISISLEHINRALGTSLNKEEVGEIFNRLAFPYTETADVFVVVIPPRRWDIHIEADIIEEVARIYGYDNLPSTLPSGTDAESGLNQNQKNLRKLHETAMAAGLSEIVSYALTTEAKAPLFTEGRQVITKLDWPMTEDRTSLRLSLLPGILDIIKYNIVRQKDNLAVYEIGKVFEQTGDYKTQLPKEVNKFAFALTGERLGKTWRSKAEKVDFYTAKGIAETILSTFVSLADIRFEKLEALKELHPGRSASILYKGESIGFVGQVHPKFAKENDLFETYVLELNLDGLWKEESSAVIFEEISKFPTVHRDIALLVDTTVDNQSLTGTILENGGRFLKDVKLFDVYLGENIQQGKKSLAYALTFSNIEATLTDEDVNAAMAKVQKKLIENYGVEIR